MPMFNQSPVSGDVVVADWPALLALPAPADGATAVVVAPVIGTTITGGISRTRWVYSQSVGWRLNGRQMLMIDVAASVGAASTAEQTLKTISVPGGLLPSLAMFRVETVFSKSGTTDLVRGRIRYDSVLISAFYDIQPANRQGGAAVAGWMTSNTQLRWAWNGQQIPIGGQNVTTAPTEITVSNVGSARNISVTCQPMGSTDIPAVQLVTVEGM